jgi:hypothetical protein
MNIISNVHAFEYVVIALTSDINFYDYAHTYTNSVVILNNYFYNEFQRSPFK